jgi:catechol 2,3-dioxygenase
MALIHRGIQRIGYVRIAVNDPRLLKSRQFYAHELGLLEMGTESNRAYFRCWHEPYQFSLVVEHSCEPGLIEIGFQVRDAADLARFESRIAQAGVAVQLDAAGAVLHAVGQSLAFAVPAGPRLRLFDHMVQPGYQSGYESPDWVVPRALRGTPAPLHLNHVGFTTPDPGGCADFLAHTLDFFTSEKMVDDDGKLVSSLMYRMSKNVGGQELALFPGDQVKLHHIAFSKEDASDILADGIHLRSDGVAIDLLGPVRQPYGNTFSLYFRDPSGVRLALCSGGRMTEPHRDFQPVVWSRAHFRKALSYYDEEVGDEFLAPSL